jgi:hypothetical protein
MQAAGGVDLIITSPPFPDARTPKQYGCAAFDTTVDGYGRLGDAVFTALKPGGVCALNIDGPIRCRRPGVGSERSLIAFKVAIDWAERVGFRYIEHGAYVRDSMPISDGPRWRSGWEPVHVFARPGAVPYFDRMGDSRPAVSAGRLIATSGRKSTGLHASSGRGRTVNARRSLTTAERFQTQGRINISHPAPFSSDLADAYVLCYSPPGGLVGDPFVGSGTVALTCRKHGRSFVGGDIGHRHDGARWADIVTEYLR